MPEGGDNCIEARILLPRGDEIARGHLVTWSYYSNGNIMKRAHMSQILDTRVYLVENTGDKVTKLTANAIAKSLYA